MEQGSHMTWSRAFDDPITTPAGKTLLTLRDAAHYIRRLQKKEQDLPHWQLAVSTLIMAAEDRGPVMHAAIAMAKALTHGHGYTEKKLRRKRVKSYRIIR